MFDLIWNMRQEARLKEIASEARAAKHAQSAENAAMERALERTELVVRAMWDLLSVRVGVTHEDLLRTMREIEASDAEAATKSDGLASCPACTRQNQRGRAACMYCGAAMPEPDVFMP